MSDMDMPTDVLPRPEPRIEDARTQLRIEMERFCAEWQAEQDKLPLHRVLD